MIGQEIHEADFGGGAGQGLFDLVAIHAIRNSGELEQSSTRKDDLLAFTFRLVIVVVLAVGFTFIAGFSSL